MTARLACHRCAWRGPLELRQACPECGATLLVEHGDGPITWDDRASGVWRYRDRLPVSAEAEPVTLGEGGTPLVELDAEPGVRVLAKLELANPSLSFKDRPVSVAATVARELGAAGLLCASTGNTAVAVASYAARARLPAVCLVPEGTPPAKLALAVAAGAAVLPVRGTYSDVHALALRLATETGWANLTSTYLNPYMLEGDKTVAFELLEQLGGDAPDAVVVPVGAGPLLAGIAQGLVEAGRATVLHAVQAAGCAPIARAFADGGEVVAWPDPVATAAGSIADPLVGYAADGQRTLEAVRASGGAAVAAGDDDLRAAARDLARAGFSVELGAAAALAGLRELRRAGRVPDGATVVLVLTGHGAKDHAATGDGAAPLPVVDPDDLTRARRALQEVTSG